MSSDSKANNRVKKSPPIPPWTSLVNGTSERGAALSFYYSDPLSKVPIRNISHKNDPKGDPNLETMTFGRFSICDRGMRATIVRQSIGLHFFCTSRRGPQGHLRVLTGYYRYGWYVKTTSARKKSVKGALDDYMLMADEMRFVSPGFPLPDLTGYLWGKRLTFRTFRYVDKETATRLLYLLNDAPNASDEYISEISRVERLVMERDKMLYRKRSEGFSWDEAANVMVLRKE